MKTNKKIINYINLRFFILSFLSSVILGISLLYSNFYSVSKINYLFLCIGLSFFILVLSQVLIDLKTVSKPMQILSILLITTSLLSSFFGFKNSVSIDGKNVLLFSKERKVYNLIYELKDEIILIQENQILFTYPKEQLSTMNDILSKAAKQAEDISRKRNPALVKNLPNEDFLDLYKQINIIAELQKNNFLKYISYVDEQSPQLISEINSNNDIIISLLFVFAEDLSKLAYNNKIEIELKNDKK